MPEFIVTLKATAEVVGSIRVEAANEVEAFHKAKEKSKKDYVSWSSSKVDQDSITNLKVFSSFKTS